MSAAKKNPAQLVNAAWEFTPSNERGSFSTDDIKLAAQVHCARQLERIGDRLTALQHSLFNIFATAIKAEAKRAVKAALRAEKRKAKAGGRS